MIGNNKSNPTSWHLGVGLSVLSLFTAKWSVTAFVVVPLVVGKLQHWHTKLLVTHWKDPLSSSSTTVLQMTKPPYSHPRDLRHKPHVFKHLFRHYEDISFDSWVRCTEPASFLRSVGFSDTELQEIESIYPNLPEFMVHDQIAPKVRFLVETLEAGSGKLAWKTETELVLDEDAEEECGMHADVEDKQAHSMRLSAIGKKLLVPFLSTKYALDRTVGPRHAFLVTQNLPHGKALLEQDGLKFLEFLQATKVSDFCLLCNQWADMENYCKESTVQDFCYEFGSGLSAAAKKHDNTILIPLLIQHGANHKESDSHGVSPLHYAAGMGNLPGVQALLSVMGEPGDSTMDKIFYDQSAKDGATAFHWACCGIDEHEIGVGGSMEVCKWMLEQGKTRAQKSDLVNACTWSQATPLMWAAWSGSRDICEYLVQHGADVSLRDKRGATVGHWAAASGDLETCQYLFHAGAMNFTETDDTGTTPLQYAAQHHGSSSELFRWMTTAPNFCSPTKSE